MLHVGYRAVGAAVGARQPLGRHVFFNLHIGLSSAHIIWVVHAGEERVNAVADLNEYFRLSASTADFLHQLFSQMLFHSSDYFLSSFNLFFPVELNFTVCEAILHFLTWVLFRSVVQKDDFVKPEAVFFQPLDLNLSLWEAQQNKATDWW